MTTYKIKNTVSAAVVFAASYMLLYVVMSALATVDAAFAPGTGTVVFAMFAGLSYIKLETAK